MSAVVGGLLFDEFGRDGARQMLAVVLLAEVVAYVEAYVGEVDEDGHRLVVRSGFRGLRVVPVRRPRVNDKCFGDETGELKRFSSAVLAAWARKSPGVA